MENVEQMKAGDEKLMARHKSSGEDSSQSWPGIGRLGKFLPAAFVYVRVTAAPLFTSCFQPINPPSWLFHALNYMFSVVTKTSKLPEPELSTYFSSADELSQNVMTCFLCLNPSETLNLAFSHHRTNLPDCFPVPKHSGRFYCTTRALICPFAHTHTHTHSGHRGSNHVHTLWVTQGFAFWDRLGIQNVAQDHL